ncbi:MAG: glycoside hydrolase family 113, partial [Planctomycetota bacterium]
MKSKKPLIHYSLAVFAVINFCVPATHAIEMKGVSYTAWKPDAMLSEDSDNSLAKVRADGCNWIAICVWWFQDNVNSTTVEPDYTRYSATPESVVHAINTCHELGMKVMLKPMVDCRDGDWRGTINPSDGWFSAYQD